MSPASPEDPGCHVAYAVETLLFAFVGWAWLAVREMWPGGAPLIEAALLLCCLLVAVVNLVAAFVVPAAAWAPFARAHFAFCVVTLLAYLYALIESVPGVLPMGDVRLCCENSTSNATLSSLYARALFGDAPLHVVPGAVTAGFLVIHVALSGAQARAVVGRGQPSDWLPDATAPAAVFALVAVVCGVAGAHHVCLGGTVWALCWVAFVIAGGNVVFVVVRVAACSDSLLWVFALVSTGASAAAFAFGHAVIQTLTGGASVAYFIFGVCALAAQAGAPAWRYVAPLLQARMSESYGDYVRVPLRRWKAA